MHIWACVTALSQICDYVSTRQLWMQQGTLSASLARKRSKHWEQKSPVRGIWQDYSRHRTQRATLTPSLQTEQALSEAISALCFPQVLTHEQATPSPCKMNHTQTLYMQRGCKDVRKTDRLYLDPLTRYGEFTRWPWNKVTAFGIKPTWLWSLWAVVELQAQHSRSGGSRIGGTEGWCPWWPHTNQLCSIKKWWKYLFYFLKMSFVSPGQQHLG